MCQGARQKDGSLLSLPQAALSLESALRMGSQRRPNAGGAQCSGFLHFQKIICKPSVCRIRLQGLSITEPGGRFLLETWLHLK